ncbi:MAG: sugar transferase [Kaistella sp.]
MYRHVLKPLFDFLLAASALILLSPVFLIVTILLTFSNKGSAFFLQRRPGRNGEIFYIIKFKTMNDKKNANGILLPDYQRMTLLGKIVRKTSLDEIPQLINVLKGEMSLIGPRPLLPEYLELYTPKQQRRHCVKPGITGLAQVNGRNAISWEEKFKYDIEYVDNISPLLDAKIIFSTIDKVLRRKNVNADNEMTMKEFKGDAT